MSTATTPEAKTWVTASAAARAVGVNRMTIRRWADERLVSVRNLPFCHAKVFLPDVEKLVNGATRAASQR